MTNLDTANSPPARKPADLSPEEKRALLARLLKEKGARPADPSVHRLFEAQAARTPDAPAVVFAGETTTYADLNARANRLARHLRTLGVGPDVLVGLCVERSSRMLVGLLAILKAGGAYVPIDPTYPGDRVEFMVADSRAPVLVTELDLVASLPAGASRVVAIDSAEHAGHPSANLDGATAPDALAYVIYTSGSTGKPKGVQVPHGALTNFLQSFRQILDIGAADALLAVTTLSFDIAGLELFLPLTVGARIELAGRDEVADGVALAARIAAGGVTFLQATPATWRLLLESGWPGSDRLTLLCGGEALPRSLADRLLPRGKALWNVYGPTETTIWSSAWKVEAGDGPVLIGRPIAQTQLYVLDARLRPVPVGVAGELYIGGAGLARGYLDRPGLTADRFPPDSLGPRPGARIYRTGALARWHADGTLECLGRVDHQVKIRGFRVELGEVEAAIAAHPRVEEVVAVAREDATGEQALVAYLIPRPGPAPTVADLRKAIGAGLPDYMIPAAFVLLDEFPLTPNGKVDRNALPDPAAARVAAAVYVPPRNAIEEAVAAAFAQVLGRDRVGARDDFFDLGGHSLMAAQLLARLRDSFGIEVPLKDLFENSNVAALAYRVEDALRARSGDALPPIGKADRSAPLPASFAQQRLWFLDQLEPGQATYNLPIAVRLKGELDLAVLGQAFDALVRRHESLRTTFDAVDGRPIQVIAPELPVDLPVDDLTHLPAAERELAALRRLKDEARRPFDLAAGPLVRVALAKLDDREHVAIVNIHHIIADGWSIGVLVRDMAAFYDAIRRGADSPLPPLAVQYADYAAWQREWLRDNKLQKQLDFWTEQLAGLPNLEIPADRPRPAVRAGRGGERVLMLEPKLVAAVRDLAREGGATSFMALLGAFQVLLARYSGQEDVAVGSPIAGRTRSELEDLIGFFANTIVFRGDLTGDPSFREVLRRSKDAVLAAVAHQDMPFDQLVTALRPVRDTSRTPLFQVMFALQNSPMPPLETPEMAMLPLAVSTDAARADLTMFAIELEEGMRIALEYDADLFLPATVDRMLRHWRTLLESILADPDAPISTLPMLSEEERRQILGQWNGAEADPTDGLPADLDNLTEAELDALLQQLDPGSDAHD